MALSGLLRRHCGRIPQLVNRRATAVHSGSLTYLRSHRTVSTDSNSSHWVESFVNEKTGVATLKLNKKPVNSLSLELITQILLHIEKLESDKAIKGAIITSSIPGIFSAGLDIMEFFEGKEKLKEFWKAVQELWIRLYGMNIPTVAAINGHSPAAGCLIALTADYRIMASNNFTIGLNETKLGIVAPWWFQETLRNTIGHRETERALQLGLMYDGESAQKVGLVDKLVDIAEVQQAAENEIDQWLKIPSAARTITKHQSRGPVIDRLHAGREDDINNFVEYMKKDSVQKLLHMYVESLKKKSKK